MAVAGVDVENRRYQAPDGEGFAGLPHVAGPVLQGYRNGKIGIVLGGASGKGYENRQVELVRLIGEIMILKRSAADDHLQGAFHRVDGHPRALLRVNDPEPDRPGGAREDIPLGFHPLDERGLGIHENEPFLAILLASLAGKGRYRAPMPAVGKTRQLTAQIHLPALSGRELNCDSVVIGRGLHQ